LGGSRLR